MKQKKNGRPLTLPPCHDWKILVDCRSLLLLSVDRNLKNGRPLKLPVDITRRSQSTIEVCCSQLSLAVGTTHSKKQLPDIVFIFILPGHSIYQKYTDWKINIKINNVSCVRGLCGRGAVAASRWLQLVVDSCSCSCRQLQIAVAPSRHMPMVVAGRRVDDSQRLLYTVAGY